MTNIDHLMDLLAPGGSHGDTLGALIPQVIGPLLAVSTTPTACHAMLLKPGTMWPVHQLPSSGKDPHLKLDSNSILEI
jgi:hypothetical protein